MSDKESFVIVKNDGSALSAQEIEEVYDYLAVFSMKKGYIIRGGDVGRLNAERQMEEPLYDVQLSKVNPNCEVCDD